MIRRFLLPLAGLQLPRQPSRRCSLPPGAAAGRSPARSPVYLDRSLSRRPNRLWLGHRYIDRLSWGLAPTMCRTVSLAAPYWLQSANQPIRRRDRRRCGRDGHQQQLQPGGCDLPNANSRAGIDSRPPWRCLRPGSYLRDRRRRIRRLHHHLYRIWTLRAEFHHPRRMDHRWRNRICAHNNWSLRAEYRYTDFVT